MLDDPPQQHKGHRHRRQVVDHGAGKCLPIAIRSAARGQQRDKKRAAGGNAQRASHLLYGGNHPGGHAGLMLLRQPEHQVKQRRHTQCLTKAQDHQPRQQSERIRQRRSPQHLRHQQRHPGSVDRHAAGQDAVTPALRQRWRKK
ncbi:hypothetical protein D3C79_897520 [compost metagenome]